MSEFVTRVQLDEAIAEVRQDIAETEQRLRREWTETVRYEVGQVNSHLDGQDIKINWVLGLIVTLLLAALSGLIYVVLHFAH